MGVLFSLFTKKHVNMDVKCEGCACHADDASEPEELRSSNPTEKKATTNKG